jgi:hypothetical protein
MKTAIANAVAEALKMLMDRPRYMPRVGYSVADWSEATGISKTAIYDLIQGQRIESVYDGGKRISRAIT